MIAASVVAAHIALLWLLLSATVPQMLPVPSAMVVFNISAPPPMLAPKPAGAAAAPAVRAPSHRGEPVVLPPQPTAPPSAPASAAPASPVPDSTGTATGSTGSGAGTSGSGSGGGQRAHWASGSISNKDYPRAVNAAGKGGTVTVNFTVAADGHVHDCRVVGSSGIAELDSTTCRLIEQRFRYTPARDAMGATVPDVAGWRQDWWLEPKR